VTHYLPISKINTYVYCPRRFYLEHVAGEERTNIHLEEGQRVHETANTCAVELKRGETLVSRRVYVASESLGVAGFIDLVEEAAETSCPIEYKKGKQGDWLNDKVQLCAQGLALEEMSGKPVPHGYLYYFASRRRQKVDFTPELRNLTRQAVAEAHRLAAEGSAIPDPLDSPKCNGCSVAPICLPDEVLYLQEKTPFPPVGPPSLGFENTLYIDTQGAYIRKRGERLIVEHEGQELRDIPLLKLDQVVLVGNVSLSAPILRLLLAQGIPVTYLSVQGRYCGSTLSPETRNALLRISQHDTRHSPTRSLELAKRFVIGKLTNMRTLIMRRARGKKREESQGEGGNGNGKMDNGGLEANTAGPVDLDTVAWQLKRWIGAVHGADSLETLLGIEGSGSAAYFRCFGSFLKGRWGFDFEKRTRRPPRDPVNALLSLAYTLLLGDLVSACHIVGLDPYVGFLHAPRYGRASLALDLMEEFRPIVADSLVVTFINNGQVDPDDFEQLQGGFFLKENARKRFYAAYEQRKTEEITHPVFEYRLPYRRAFELQARILAKYLMGEIEAYEPLVVR
jgi:CRISPR-associated protein Cas1